MKQKDGVTNPNISAIIQILESVAVHQAAKERAILHSEEKALPIAGKTRRLIDTV